MAVGAGLAPAACGPAAEPGLRPRAHVQFDQGAHLGELLVQGDFLYVANSNDALATLRLHDAVGLTVTQREPATFFARCTTLAAHAPSRTIYCGADEGELLAYSVEDPARPALRKPITAEQLPVRDLHVDGDTLLLARFEDGLWQAPIEPDGDIDEDAMRPTPLAANVHHVDGAGPTLAALALERGLVPLIHDAVARSELTVGPALALDGPLINLRVRGSMALVALGSAGASIAELRPGGAPIERARLRPPGVVTSVDLRGDRAAVITLSGVYLYDLRALDLSTGTGEARLAGFVNTGERNTGRPGAALDGQFVGDALVVVDWYRVNLLDTELDGVALELEHPGGVYYRQGDALSIPLRNPGDATLEVRALQDVHELGRARLEPSAPDEPPSQERLELAALPSPTLERVTLEISTVDEFGLSHDVGEQLLVPARAGAGDPPAAGDPLPRFAYADGAGQLQLAPLDGTPTRIMFHATDCAAMWPVLQDLAWLARRPDPPFTPLLVSAPNLDRIGFARRWGLEGVRHGHHDDPSTPASVREHNAVFGAQLYEDGFMNTRLPYGNLHPTEYVTDEQGVIIHVSREYRGAHEFHDGP
ncbi:MAG: hypothetical protein H6713_40030 [Myxococcales bacterium]|nr:hypothetical protein [Myxococcales bacterium]